MNVPENLERAIIVDEVGMVSARQNEFVITTSYRPVFERSGPFIRLAAVEAEDAIFRFGERASSRAFDRHLQPADADRVRHLCSIVHTGNLVPSGFEQLDLHLNPYRGEPAEGDLAIEDIHRTAMRMLQLGMHTAQLVCKIDLGKTPDIPKGISIVGELCRHGIRVETNECCAEGLTVERDHFSAPDIVRIDGSRFAKLAELAGTGQLFARHIEQYQMRHIKVLVSGIDNQDLLRVALDANADYFIGKYLGRSALAGTAVNTEPRPIARLLGNVADDRQFGTEERLRLIS